MRREADLYLSGYLIPGLSPIVRNGEIQKWGGINGCARGVFYTHDSNKGFGFLRYLKTADSELWRTDSREGDSPYGTVFCHDSEIPKTFDASTLPNRNVLFEFKIVETKEGGKTKATDIQIIKTRT